jgi:hypothetical protein
MLSANIKITSFSSKIVTYFIVSNIQRREERGERREERGERREERGERRK